MGLTRAASPIVPTVAIALGAAFATSPWWARRPRSIDVVTAALAPWVPLAGLPAAALAAAGRRPGLAGVGVIVGSAGIALRRWVRGTVPMAPLPTTGPAEARIGHFNVWFENRRPGCAAMTLVTLDLDVLVLSEMTAGLTERFESAGIAEQYPYRIDRPRPFADGMVVWSASPARRVDRGTAVPRTDSRPGRAP